MISSYITRRVRAAMWYVIDTHAQNNNTSERAAAERALAGIPTEPTLAEITTALDVAMSMTRSAMDIYKSKNKITCVVGHKIMHDLQVSANSIRKLHEQQRLNHPDS